MGEEAAMLCKIASDLFCLAQRLPNGIARGAAVEAAIILSDAAVPLEAICSWSGPFQQHLGSGRFHLFLTPPLALSSLPRDPAI